jgi:hypothetical protein
MILDSGGYQTKGGAIYSLTAYQGAETLYVCIIYGFMKYSKRGLTLINDVTTSDRSVHTPTVLKIDPTLRGVSG